jgi:hypothetical protein
VAGELKREGKTMDRPRSWSPESAWDKWKDPVFVDWDRVRSQIEHEDHLINHRITWVIQINTMLLAAFAAAAYFFRAPGGDQKGTAEPIAVAIVVFVLVAFGVLVSYVTYRSVRLANKQIACLVEWWKERVKEDAGAHPNLKEALGLHHPPIVGEAGHGFDIFFRYSYVVPASFFVLWLGLAAAYFYNFVAL